MVNEKTGYPFRHLRFVSGWNWTNILRSIWQLSATCETGIDHTVLPVNYNPQEDYTIKYDMLQYGHARGENDYGQRFTAWCVLWVFEGTFHIRTAWSFIFCSRNNRKIRQVTIIWACRIAYYEKKEARRFNSVTGTGYCGSTPPLFIERTGNG